MPAVDADDAKRFLHPATIAKVGRLDLRAKQLVEGFIAGLHKSPFFGQSMEFAQHREYVSGDDIRHLDWKVWSKTDKYYIKQYEAETNLRANLVVDTSESMGYGTEKHRKNGTLSKYEYACTAAACLAYIIVRQQDSAGVTSFGWDVKQAIPPKSSQRQLDAITKTVNATKPEQGTRFDKVLRTVAEASHGRGLTVIFSDLLTDREPLFKGLELLRHRKQDVAVFHILDDDELDFPFDGTTKFEGLEDLPELTCDPKALRAGYLEALDEYLVEVRRGCTRLGIDYGLTRTGDYLDAILSRFLFRRADRSASGRR
jgi:uncharacterized protein (DUF58 family)